jgi:hypothetical protein
MQKTWQGRNKEPEGLPEDSSKDELDKRIIQTVKEKKPENIRQLVDLMREKSESSEQEIINRVFYLQEKGKIRLASQSALQPKSFTYYLRSSYAHWFWITVTLTLATMVVVFVVPEDDFPLVYARYALGIIFILWLPGYAFIEALFPQGLPWARGLAHSVGTSEKNLDIVERVALSLGMSIALVPIVGLLLNYTPWGIRLAPIVLSLTALTIVFATVAVLREHQVTIKQDADRAE